MPVIEFTDNYQDLSTDQGFQFKFHCERCGDGFMSSFQTNTIGVAGPGAKFCDECGAKQGEA